MSLVPSWRRRGAIIQRTYEFKDFPAAIKFVNAVARIAEKAWHHPDIDIRGNRVTLALTTHDAGGLTRKDFELAASFDAVIAPKRKVPRAKVVGAPTVNEDDCPF